MPRIRLQDSITLTPDLTESVEELPNGHLRAVAKVQHCGIVNRNNRLYPIPVWEQHLKADSPFMEAVRRRGVWGHLEHPQDGRPDLKQAAVIITEPHMRNNGEIWATIETLSSRAGTTAKSLIGDGLSIGISSRAHGSVQKNAQGVDEVQMDFIPEAFDLVSEPSTPGAYLQESLQNELTAQGEEAVKLEERMALCQIQLEGLRDELLQTTGWRPTWRSRLNDIKFFAKGMAENSQLKSDIAVLEKSLTVKHSAEYRGKDKPPNKATVNFLIEQADQAAKDAQAAADQAEKSAQDAAGETGNAAPADAEVAATQAKIAAGEAEAAAKAAAEAETEAGVEVAAQQAAAAAERAKLAAAQAAGGDATGAITPEEVVATDAKICHTVDVEIDFERLSDAAKKKINVFRPGEELETLRVLIGSEMESLELPVKQLDLLWSMDKIRAKVEVDGDPVNARDAIMGLLELRPEAAVPEPPPETTIVQQAQEPTTMATEAFNGTMARRQQIKTLQEEVRTLRQETARLKLENKNLSILNNEMAAMFESEIVKFETAALLQKEPALKKFESFLLKTTSLDALHETAQQFRQTLDDSWEQDTPIVVPPPKPRKEVVPPRTPYIDDSGLPPMPLHEDVGNPVTDGSPKSSGGDTCSRLAAHRARKTKK